MTDRENTIRAMEFAHPEWIPCRIVVHQRRSSEVEEIQELVREHPRIFPPAIYATVDFHAPGERISAGDIRDSWGCLWRNILPGVIGQVIEHPLANWDTFGSYHPPDPIVSAPFGIRDWSVEAARIQRLKEHGLLAEGNGENLFDKLYELRGFENLMIDIATGDPRLEALVDMLTDYEVRLVEKWLEIGVDRMYFHTDIGTQQALMISPASFRAFLKPMFQLLFGMCRDAGVHVRLSSDGVLLEIVEDLLECGVTLHDPQLRANRLDRIVTTYKGRMCAELDLDRQLFPFCSTKQVRDHVRECVEAMYLPEGGLMLAAANTPDVPIRNIRAQCEAFEEFCLSI
jgi:uroporphyrinogen decarboxylase